MISLVTASMPVRGPMLVEMLGSVAAQSVTPAAHLIEVSEDRIVPKMNRLVGLVEDGWFCQVDDDDLLYPNHVEVLSANLTADVVWTWCDVVGRDWSPNEPYQPGMLQARNYIPSNCAIRVEAWRAVGGHRDVPGRYEDHDLLARLEAAGATFLNVPEVTWQYRFHGGNTSVC